MTINNDADGISFSNSLPTNQSGSFHSATGENVTAGIVHNYFKDINGTRTQGLQGGEYADVLNVLGNKDEYVFNIISAPGLIYEFGLHSTQLDTMISLAETRGDCIAVVDLQNYGATVANVTSTANSLNSSYGACLLYTSALPTNREV